LGDGLARKISDYPGRGLLDRAGWFR